MSAMILNMSDFARIFSPDLEAVESVRRQLHYRCHSVIVSQACARAQRSIRAGVNQNVAVERAVSWALAQIDTPPEAA